MRNITLSADERLIEAAREKAREEHTTLNEQFRRWLEEYAGRKQRAARAMEVVDEIRKYAYHSGRRFTREEMYER